jgi:RNA polymerase sigma factor (sigma-70 family)
MSSRAVDVDRGDDELFARLYPSLRRLAAAMRPVGADPDDIVQEAVARTLAVRPLRELDEPMAYLRTAVVRIALDHRRREARAEQTRQRLGVREATSDSEIADAAGLDVLRALPSDTRALLYLVTIEGLPYREVAAMIGCSERKLRVDPTFATEVRR